MRPNLPEPDLLGFHCDTCGQRFRTPEELERHRARAHEGRPSAPRCEACDETFESPSDLKVHNQRAHHAPEE
jgi:uncharacterized C2H2 Zn-finger protein